ncbi:hypothetical protein MIND_00460800 [Mycena indigotica]|uniref:Septin-type G domain-containing protein n=1 Tax=Mycena indigotica TaxID=2126181 RepID=A0A8H6W8A3_9AGAR|nr:uncharacterized protein MIND_00460800 [Mycena indigotica]KAF7306691.1 hypothetical protein MIND_00460800 [Mycena indigotica]
MSFAARRRGNKVKKGVQFTVMVVGASGTGRTTFVNTLCESEVLTHKVSDDPETAHIEVGVKIKPVNVELEEDGVRIALTIVDTPGFGDNIDNEAAFQEIMGYLERQYDDILAEESRIKRNPRFRDNRVHALLYFIPPTGHSLREMDIELMRRLSPRVNVIPVIGKADTLTPSELKGFKKRIMEDIEHYDMLVYNFPYDIEEDDEDTIQDNSELRALLPFAIIGSEEEVEVDGQFVQKLSRSVNPDMQDSSILPEEMANQSVRLKEEQLRKEEEKLREIELRVQREITERRQQLLAKAIHDAAPLADDVFSISHVYEHTNGYAGRFSQLAVEHLRTMPEVDFIERDQVVRIQETQKLAPWGLARVSHRKKLSLGTFTRYDYDPSGGDGVDVYVIDTGININHEEFQGRASWGATIPQNDVDEDGNGHGTHCAGTIASRKFGVAKAANVIAVKVLGSNGSGSMSDVIGGVNFATTASLAKKAKAEAEFKATGKTAHKGSVANMSLGGGKSDALDRAVNAAVDKGLHFAVAAGNDNRDACNYSPAAAEKAVTVGASTLSDERAYFSNFGKCVDVFAPGLNIRSTWIGSTSAENTISGTSMASPHTAGMLAYLLSLYPSKAFDPKFDAEPLVETSVFQRPMAIALSSTMYIFGYSALPNWAASLLPSPVVVEETVAPIPTLTPAQLKRALLQLATPNALSDLPAETVNLLIFNNFTSTA